MQIPTHPDIAQTELPELSSSALTLLHTAEQLIAEKGVDGVSSREIARRAGQKNHSAVNYNFGSFEGLVEALINYRVGPVNRRREQQLSRLLAESELPSLEALVALMVRPLAEELLSDTGARYLGLLVQLTQRPPWRDLFMRNRARSSAIRRTSTLAEQHLLQWPEHIRQERLRLQGFHTVQVVAEWDTQIRGGELDATIEALGWRIDDFIHYSVAGLQAPAGREQ
ncbi:helix-turn-helix transcriptional regulator [Parahaliea maris]|uniref:Helix-turn-helix transcriptional regulator n=1 Tax=Parahaliea maris TaxID=2716870 RepID=A0A5C9A7E4_9GAMM|nr:TetR/AcrR family transcriptional regulator [Parahaliea maris]TXS96658.1 helix-turn-helix transcriptional regulator [Parahaliea maris]